MTAEGARLGYHVFEGLLAGQVAVVTGAGQGNGEAIARGLAACGAQVVLSDVNAAAAEAVAADICKNDGHAIALTFDVTDRAAVDAAAKTVREKCGPVAILINNAGIIERMLIDDDDLLDSAERLWRVNAQGPLTVTRAFLDQLRETGGRVVNLASICSFISYSAVTGYAASKGAVAQLTKALAVELAADGVRVNAIAPGVISTPMTRETREDPERLAAFVGQTPMGRIGEADELVGPVIFLSSKMSSYVTGTIIPVDGGYLCR